MLLHDATTTDTDTATDVERVRAAVAQLPPAERDLLVLRFRDDLDAAALAARLSTTPAVVQRRLRHAGWVVQDVAGDTPAQWRASGTWPAWETWNAWGTSRATEQALLRGRPSHLVEEEATAGITPLLAARIAVAVAGEPPAADEHWRARSLLRQLRSHVDALLLVLLVVAVGVPAAVSLASM